MSVYVNADDILECVVSVRQNPDFNKSPQTDSALQGVRITEKGATNFDKLCHKVFAANGNGTDFLSRGTGQLCRWCGNNLEAYYCESRLFMVECHFCKTRALVMAGNAQEAAFKTFGEVSE